MSLIKRILLFLLVVYIPLFPTIIDADYMLRGLEKADFIKVRAYCHDNVVNVDPVYINTDEDRLVFWTHGTVSCQWTLYKYEIKTQKRGVYVKTGRQTLRRSDQGFYIDLKYCQTYGSEWLEIECTFTWKGRYQTATDIFLIH